MVIFLYFSYGSYVPYGSIANLKMDQNGYPLGVNSRTKMEGTL
uniref:Uncharacterized protein n=1 Tax=Arundo donax TaxID=35708 RepID=A0A0A8ZM41_ARUDO